MKKHHIHRFAVLVLVLFVGIQLCACGNTEPTIVGDWQGDFRFEYLSIIGLRYRESGDKLSIYEDGTFRIDGENGDSNGRYELLYDGECITFNFGDCAYGPYDIRLESRNTLVIETNDDTFYLERIS